MGERVKAFFQRVKDDKALKSRMQGVSGAVDPQHGPGNIPFELVGLYGAVHALLGTQPNADPKTDERAHTIMWQIVYLRNPTQKATVDWFQVAQLFWEVRCVCLVPLLVLCGLGLGLVHRCA